MQSAACRGRVAVKRLEILASTGSIRSGIGEQSAFSVANEALRGHFVAKWELDRLFLGI
jgi:hypothetical protein